MVRVDLNEKLSFEQRLERGDRVKRILQGFHGSVSQISLHLPTSPLFAVETN